MIRFYKSEFKISWKFLNACKIKKNVEDNIKDKIKDNLEDNIKDNIKDNNKGIGVVVFVNLNMVPISIRDIMQYINIWLK